MLEVPLIQAFTFSYQDHGQLPDKCMSKRSQKLSRSRSVARGRGGVVCCVGGVCFCVFVLFCFFSLNSLLSLSCSLSFLLLSLSFFSLLSSLFFPSSLFCLLSSLPLPLLSPLLATKHCGKNRSTNTAANFEAFECDLAHGRCTAVGSLPPSLPSLLPSLPLFLKKKRRGNFFYHRNISGDGFIFITVLN